MQVNSEREFFTQERLRLLSKYPALAKTEYLGKYCFVPLDIPRIEDPEFSKWFFDKCIPITRINTDIAGLSVGGSLFDAIDVFPQGSDFGHDTVWSVNIQNEFLDLFSGLYKQMLEHLPFKEIWRIRFFSSSRLVPFHRDHSKFVDFPGAFRIMLHNENTSTTLRLVDYPFNNPTNNYFSIPKLSETNSFVWNNLRTKHGSIFNSRGRKVLAVLDYGEIDVDKYIDLIERSVLKYKEYTMISNNKITDYIS